MTNNNKTVLYIGVTANLIRRVYEHRHHEIKWSFTDRYNCENCIYYEKYNDINQAIERETQLKKWSRKKKEILINSKNPNWTNLVIDNEIINIDDLN
ncbi:MAG: GIY-YIG nuclease family protein [Bacteroidales bacterium]|nr:GIY-YIG nuclease family protein [Bacteroidales bacterium]